MSDAPTLTIERGVSLTVERPTHVVVVETAGVPGVGFADAPQNDQTYGRRNGAWAPVSGASLPAGGITGDVMTKLSNTDGDAAWSALPEPAVNLTILFENSIA
jgi:hypothetical protein